jgi:hypothetical protein
MFLQLWVLGLPLLIHLPLGLVLAFELLPLPYLKLGL